MYVVYTVNSCDITCMILFVYFPDPLFYVMFATVAIDFPVLMNSVNCVGISIHLSLILFLVLFT